MYLHNNSSIFTTELESIISDLRYIKSTTNKIKFLLFRDYIRITVSVVQFGASSTVLTCMRVFKKNSI